MHLFYDNCMCCCIPRIDVKCNVVTNYNYLALSRGDFCWERTCAGRVHNWMNDEGCTSACGLEQRMLLIVNASDLRVYMMDPEHDSSRAHVELRDSTNVTIFGIKAEGNHPVMWAENTSLVTYGFGGMANADALPGDTLWPRALFILSGGCNATLFSLPTREVCRNDSFPTEWSVVYHQREPLSPASDRHRAESPRHHSIFLHYSAQAVRCQLSLRLGTRTRVPFHSQRMCWHKTLIFRQIATVVSFY